MATDSGASRLARLAELVGWGSEPELNALDSLMWRTERPPSASWTGVVVHIFASTPDWQQFVSAHEWAIGIVPRFAERVMDPLLPTGPPVWTADPNFDLSYHLRRVSLPAPGRMEQLLDMAQTLAVTPLDRKRSPWVGVLVEGLEGGRSAYVLQAHHVLMDGAGHAQLLTRILSESPTGDRVAVPERAPRPAFTPVSATVHGAAKTLSGLGRLPRRLAATSKRSVAHPAEAAEYAGSMLRVARPVNSPRSTVLAGGSRTAWRFGTLECELVDLKRAAKSVGGTVNDAFVAAVLGGVRAYCQARGEDLPDVPISMPISVRRPDEPMGGNRFTAAFFPAPSGTADPAQRIREMRTRVQAVREEPAVDFLNILTPVMNLAPSALVTATLAGLTSNAFLTTSCWPGLTEPRYMAGSRLERMFFFGPLPGTSMCAALATHVGTCCIGVNVDGEVFKDTEDLWKCLEHGLGEVLALGQGE